MNYLNRLQTPHAEYSPEKQEPLLDALDREMQAMPADHSVYEKAYKIGDVVRRTLRYMSSTDVPVSLDPDEMARDHYTNCYGYTLVLSEALQRHGIDHLVAHLDPHSFTVVLDEQNQPWVVDALALQLSGELNDGDSLNAVGSAVQRAKTVGRSAMLFDGERYVNRLAACTDKQDTLDTYRWLNYSRSHVSIDSRFNEEIVVRRPAVLSMFERDRGRAMLVDHLGFVEELRRGSAELAYQKLVDLGEDYPLVDARKLHVEVDGLIRKLIKTTNFAEAVDCVAVVLNATRGVTPDIRHSQWAVEWLAKIGRAADSVNLLGCAAVGYRAVARNSRYPRIPELKAEKIESRLAEAYVKK